MSAPRVEAATSTCCGRRSPFGSRSGWAVLRVSAGRSYRRRLDGPLAVAGTKGQP